VLLPRLEDDLLLLVQHAIARRLDQLPPLRWLDQASVGIGLVAQGYPHHFPVGGAVGGLSDIDAGVLVFHSHTHNPNGLRYTPQARGRSGLASLLMGSGATNPMISTSDGHVLTVVALSATGNGARGRALINAERISFPGRYFRGDIGQKEFG
jgi:phosphoribosylamine--glycine ligase